VHDTEFYAYADFRRWAVTGAWLRVVVWRAVGGDGEVLGQVAGWDLYGYIGVFFYRWPIVSECGNLGG
jgi:hypothetical protein